MSKQPWDSRAVDPGPWMPLEDWKAAARDGKAPERVGVRKYLTATIEKQGDADVTRTMRFRITTGDPDRDHDVIDPTGWELKHYLKNPVVLFAHDYGELPVAKATSISQDADGLTSTAEFPPKGLHPFADTVFEFLTRGFLSAVSVGFKPKKFAFNAERGGTDFEEQELLEFSVVPVPSNPFALVQASAQGLDVSLMKAWAKGILEGNALTAEDRVWVAKLLEGDEATYEEEGEAVGLSIVEKPFANEHACRVRSPGDFQRDSFRRVSRRANGKRLDLIVGRLRGETSTTLQAYRYPKDDWSASEARTHCREHDGQLFEPAKDAQADADFCPSCGRAEREQEVTLQIGGQVVTKALWTGTIIRQHAEPQEEGQKPHGSSSEEHMGNGASSEKKADDALLPPVDLGLSDDTTLRLKDDDPDLEIVRMDQQQLAQLTAEILGESIHRSVEGSVERAINRARGIVE